jgi:hypothetical protein
LAPLLRTLPRPSRRDTEVWQGEPAHRGPAAAAAPPPRRSPTFAAPSSETRDPSVARLSRLGAHGSVPRAEPARSACRCRDVCSGGGSPAGGDRRGRRAARAPRLHAGRAPGPGDPRVARARPGRAPEFRARLPSEATHGEPRARPRAEGGAELRPRDRGGAARRQRPGAGRAARPLGARRGALAQRRAAAGARRPECGARSPPRGLPAAARARAECAGGRARRRHRGERDPVTHTARRPAARPLGA